MDPTLVQLLSLIVTQANQIAALQSENAQLRSAKERVEELTANAHDS